MTKINLGSFKVDALSKEEVITQIKSKILKSVEPNILVTPNAGHLTNIFDNPELSEIYSTAELSLIDGWPIAVAAKNASKLKLTRVTGSDLLPELFTQLTKDVRVGIIGGNNESLIRQSLESRFPDLNIQIVDTSQWTNSVYDIRRLRELVQYNALSIVFANFSPSGVPLSAALVIAIIVLDIFILREEASSGTKTPMASSTYCFKSS